VLERRDLVGRAIRISRIATALRALLDQSRGRAKERGSITLEWMVVIGILFAAAGHAPRPVSARERLSDRDGRSR
jgi:hypothetical protein